MRLDKQISWKKVKLRKVEWGKKLNRIKSAAGSNYVELEE